MIRISNLTLSRGGVPLIEGADVSLHPGWKVGVTGANGCGKSSLFAMLCGELHADKGDVALPPGWVIARVTQETPALPDAALAFVLDGDEELRALEGRLRAAEAADDGEAIGSLHARLGEIDGYAARARASALLAGLGFSESDLSRPVAEFSGGWRMRLNLARALMCRSDLLLLDEPTNHLDLDAVIWLEGWLRQYRGTLLMVSHDRDFLDAVVGHILLVDQRRLTLARGNYSEAERMRAAQLAQQQSMFERQQRERAHLHSFVERFRAKATKARQAQSRLKALARMEEIAPAHVDAPFHFAFAEPTAMPDPLLLLTDVAVGYEGVPLLQGVQLTLRPGERIGLLGRNGAGKSTLVKLLAGRLVPLAGERREGKGLAIGYFDQHQVDALRPDETPLWHLQRIDPAAREQDLRDFLGGFDFHGEQATRQVAPFSGGEKARLALALIVYRRPNLLLLDEPTNHLDLEMREALTLALAAFEGGIVLVSHDRHLLRTTADQLMLVADGELALFDGDLDDYAAWLDAQRSSARGDAGRDAAREARREARAEAEATRQQRLAKRRPLVKEIDKIEKKLAGWQGERNLLDTRLNDTALYESEARERLEALLKRQADLNRQIEQAENRWLEAQAELEALEDANSCSE